jgi:hypothetical protein
LRKLPLLFSRPVLRAEFFESGIGTQRVTQVGIGLRVNRSKVATHLMSRVLRATIKNVRYARPLYDLAELLNVTLIAAIFLTSLQI